jgi:type I restriction enzyme M protein
MANGSMTTSLSNEEEARKALVDERFVDCIVQLPDQLFFGTGIPACLWFLSRNRNGDNGERERKDEILFLDARDMGELVERTKRVLSGEEIRRLEEVYHRFRFPGDPVEEEAGFSAVASLDEVRSNGHKLTPGLYVGFADDDEEQVPFEIKMPQLIDELGAQFAESGRLQAKINRNLISLSDMNGESSQTDGRV